MIGSGHYVALPGGGFSPVDVSPAGSEAAIREAFSGDAYRYAAAYYEGLAARLRAEPRVDIVGHFDLVAKFNEGGRLFDESDPRYRSAALDALDAVVKKHPRFEINTGAMSRGWRSAPYPAPFLLKRLRARSRPHRPCERQPQRGSAALRFPGGGGARTGLRVYGGRRAFGARLLSGQTIRGLASCF